MYLSNLALSDFRNYHEAVAEFSPGVMVLVGKNGQGKTNLVEAIAYLATFSSHRVSSDVALVRAGTPGAVIRAKVVSGGVAVGRATTLELEVIAGRANRARLNRGAVRPRDLLGYVKTVVFAPEDLALVKGDPAERRRFLDELMIQHHPRMAAVRSEYDKILRQRSALLKQLGGRRGRPDPYAETTLDVWDAQLAENGARIMEERDHIVAVLTPLVEAAYRDVSNSERLATLTLATSLKKEEERARITLSENPDQSYEQRLLAVMKVLRSREIERGVSLVGPHRDDLTLAIGDLPSKGYASHGESWSFALALRLASFQLLATADGDPPILILDDVFAELDAARRSALAQMVSSAEQVFVTSAVEDDLPEELVGVKYRVSSGMIERDGALEGGESQ